MRLIVAGLAAVLGLAAAGCGSTPSSDQTAPAQCLEASSGFLKVLGITAGASAVAEAVTQSTAGLNRNGRIWFVSTKDGATWVTNADPTGADPGGLVLPLNSAARAASQTGVDVAPGAPVYAGATDDGSGATASRACAAKLP